MDIQSGIRELAVAALDLINAEKYDGDEIRIYRLIESRFFICPEVQAEIEEKEILDEFVKSHPKFNGSNLKLSVVGNGIMIIKDNSSKDDLQVVGIKKSAFKPWTVGKKLDRLLLSGYLKT